MTKLFLHELHQKAGANFIQVMDHQIPADYSDVKMELEAATHHIALLDRSYLGKLALTGEDSLDLLNRISTNDLQHLAVGTVCDTIFASPKGRLIDFCRVINTGEELLLISSFYQVKHLIEWINRFIIFEDVVLQDASAEYAWLTILGPHSKVFLGQLSGKAITDQDEAIWIKMEKISFLALKNNNFKIPAYNFCIRNNEAKHIIRQIIDKIRSFNGHLIGDTAFQIIRVESGMPDWGTEITQDYNPHEARLTSAISFTKGCYTGQEVIARLDTYDKVQKYLMIVELSQKLVQNPPMDIYIDDEHVGHLTSYVFDPVTKRSIGLGYIKKIYTTDDNIYVEIHTENLRIPARLRIPPQAYLS